MDKNKPYTVEFKFLDFESERFGDWYIWKRYKKKPHAENAIKTLTKKFKNVEYRLGVDNCG